MAFPRIKALPRYLTLVAAAAALTVAAGCASRGPNASLETARSDVNRTAQDANVARLAPVELKAAQEAIGRADQELRNKGDGAEVNHLAYVAAQRADIARTVARARLADEQVRQAGAQVTQTRLEARTAEADAARAEASAAQAQAAAAQAQAQTANQQAAAAQAQVQDMRARMAEIEAQQTERGLLVTLGDLNFETGKFQLLPSANARLDKLANFLKQYPDRKVLVEGFTDSTGGAALNMTLSKHRADAVRSALVTRGIAADRIATAGHGTAYPVASNASAEGRAQNRRVEVVITDDTGKLQGRRN